MRTGQQEFDYPSGADNVKTRYDGRGGFPVSSIGMRIAAALHYGDANILLTKFADAGEPDDDSSPCVGPC